MCFQAFHSLYYPEDSFLGVDTVQYFVVTPIFQKTCYPKLQGRNNSLCAQKVLPFAISNFAHITASRVSKYFMIVLLLLLLQSI
jgi:hypothetical protein